MNDRQRIAELEQQMLRMVKHAAAMASAIAALQQAMLHVSRETAEKTAEVSMN
jgi:hypothetical protein